MTDLRRTKQADTSAPEQTVGLYLYDMHCHLSQIANAEEVARDAAGLGIAIFDCGVEPSAFANAQEYFGRAPNVACGAGLHPWWLSDGRCDEHDIAKLCALAERTRLIGEIGLDFSRAHADSRELQTRAFDELCAAIAARPNGRRVLSIHAVQSAGAALDMLEKHGLVGNNAHGKKSLSDSESNEGTLVGKQAQASERPQTDPVCGLRADTECAQEAGPSPAVIFHWFSGSGEELVRARKLGCFFSVNEMMLNTRRGRAYARQIPLECLLLETDAPPGLGKPYSAKALVDQLERTLNALAEIRDVSPETLAKRIAHTSAKLLGIR